MSCLCGRDRLRSSAWPAAPQLQEGPSAPHLARSEICPSCYFRRLSDPFLFLEPLEPEQRIGDYQSRDLLDHLWR